MRKNATPIITALTLLASTAIHAADLVPIPSLGLRVERGFRVSLFADHDLAPDTWCMTLDARGRVVVGNGQSIRTLADDDGDGAADRTVEFARLDRGVMGLCFDGTSLYAAADGWLQRYDDADGDNIADGPPDRLIPLALGEHGGHAMRKGPDGWWYLIGGNDTGFTEEKHATITTSPIRVPEAGALLRLTPDGRQSEIFAHGFRNPYDFDFNFLGDIFTYDSDVERDAFLPWYLPTRVYHAGYGQHHGWRLGGYQRSWPRPEYYADTVPMLASAGRGSPTGVTIYRHLQFPPGYLGGMFFADWTFGRIYFMPLEVNGASYTLGAPEIFLEPIGTHGFAPTDLEVAPDGSLVISIGGRKTRGAVYRVEYTGARMANPLSLLLLPNEDLNNVLAAPQPLDAWSRAIWMPAAARLGAQPIASIMSDETMPVPYRVRAIEVLTEMFGGVPPARARALAQSDLAAVRARMAWALGRLPGENAPALLRGLAMDREPMVRRFALEAIADQIELFDGDGLIQLVQAGLADGDKYVRLAATRVASLLDNDSWEDLTTVMPRNSPAVVQAAIAQVWRTSERLVHPEVIGPLTNLLAQTRDPFTRRDVMRALILGLGDWNLKKPSIEVFTAYEPAAPPPEAIDAPSLRQVVRAQIPSGNALLDFEAARLLAMLEDDDRNSPVLLVNFLTESSTATSDFHYLTCLARLRASRPELASRIAGAVLTLDRKLAGQEARVKQNWNVRLAEVVQQLVRRDSNIGDALLRHPQFATPAHVFIAGALEGERKRLAARRYLAALQADTAFPLTSELVALLSLLPRDEIVPIFRRHWNRSVAVRDEILPRLAEDPLAADRDKFLAGLSSTQPAVVRASLEALLKLPPNPSGTNLVAPLKLLHRLTGVPAERPLRAQVMTLVTNSLKQAFPVREPDDADPAALREAYEPVFNFVAARYPGIIRAMGAEDSDDPVRWNAFWKGVVWERGRVDRGAQLFAARACAGCHGTDGAIGPNLAGVAQRMSAADLMNSIVFPSRDIAPPYRTTTFRLRNGEVHTGIVAFESADGWIVQTGAGASVRIYSADVVSRHSGTISIMPSGLLSGVSPQDVADLYAYLRSLEPQ
jgi:putative membrane-bound dehydrogenase-like protein